MSISDSAALVLAAMLLDAVIGDPRWLYRVIPHPTVLMGRALSFCDRLFNRPRSRRLVARIAGALSALAVVVSFGALAVLVDAMLGRGWGGFWLEALLASALIAQNSLYRHVAAVATAQEGGGVEAGRTAVTHIVGRDPKSLDSHGVARAAVESLAENFNDGVVAPVFWGLLFGLPGMVAYKALNTADSMIGHLDFRYRDFGWAAARLDDVANWAPARIAGVLLALSGGQRRVGIVAQALEIMWRDGGAHRSVNAGYPEGAMAGALDLRLAGPRHYQGAVTPDPWLGNGTMEATAHDIRRGLRVYVGACALLFLVIGAPWLAAGAG